MSAIWLCLLALCLGVLGLESCLVRHHTSYGLILKRRILWTFVFLLAGAKEPIHLQKRNYRSFEVISMHVTGKF